MSTKGKGVKARKVLQYNEDEGTKQKKRGRPKKIIEEEEDEEDEEYSPKKTTSQAKRGRPKKQNKKTTTSRKRKLVTSDSEEDEEEHNKMAVDSEGEDEEELAEREDEVPNFRNVNSCSSIEDVKRKYKVLYDYRITKPEKLVQDMRKHLKEREQATNDVVEQMKLELEKIKKEKNTKETKTTKSNKEEVETYKSELNVMEQENENLQKELEEAKREIEELKKEKKSLEKGKARARQSMVFDLNKKPNPEEMDLLQFFSNLTGLSVEKEGEKYVCSGFNTFNKNRIQFELSKTEEGDMDYNPITWSINDGVMPESLQEGIYFDELMLPQFFQRVLVAMFGAPVEES